MMNNLIIDNYLIDKPIIDILYEIQAELMNGKLRDIKQNSNDISVTCPFHAEGREQHPDMHINLSAPGVPYGWTHCFACGKSTNFVSFVAACFDKNEEFAKNWLITKYGIKQKEKIILGDSIVVKRKTKASYLNDNILDKYQDYCLYLQKRKISREVCKLFNVKYDAENKQILFPCYDERGNLITIPTRKTDYKQFHLDSGIEKPVYGLDKIISQNIKTCILTEGPFDALTAWTYGMPAVCSLGSISIEQIEKINKSPITSLILMFDNDEAGRKFTEFVKAKISKRIFITEAKIPAGYKDINDLDYITFWNILKNFQKN